MREIKFRAWDGDRYWFKVVPLGNTEIILNHPLAGNKLHPIKELQQFTGLKDKNRKEIYEGDIVLVKKQIIDEPHMMDNNTLRICKDKVIFSEGMFGVMGWGGNPLIKWDSIEVIGNTYENPELLK